jgi:hypothetical protein
MSSRGYMDCDACSLVGGYRCFGGPYCLHLHGEGASGDVSRPGLLDCDAV